ncbi:hypothetical protein N4G62_16205 [Sphingomonas sanguinis]|uniref:Uncharacterized protein n=1 Tax=Sphingomonas sanguinis TaxID=33051 RepID=A0ABU5LUF8_9SPHN|nr:hypothetical protein [Sphingomonas sanguinis]MDZ7283573.1 hypothetical protein [Sphingomonas sanguinis]
MTPKPLDRHPVSHKATLRLSAGRAVDLRFGLRVTSGGLLAIGGLVSSILLSTAVLVGVATRHLPDRDSR